MQNPESEYNCVDGARFDNISSNNHSTNGNEHVSFSGANLHLVQTLRVGGNQWIINAGRTSSMISVNSLPGMGKDYPIEFIEVGMLESDKKSTGLTFSYAAPVIYNITA